MSSSLFPSKSAGINSLSIIPSPFTSRKPIVESNKSSPGAGFVFSNHRLSIEPVSVSVFSTNL